MARLRFIAPERDRYTLADGEDWIEIKRDLTVEEDRFLKTAGLRGMSNISGGDAQNATVDVDWKAYALARVMQYLLDWSFKGPDGKDVPVTPSAIAALDTESFEEIESVITRHVEARAAEKKARTGVKPSENASISAVG